MAMVWSRSVTPSASCSSSRHGGVRRARCRQQSPGHRAAASLADSAAGSVTSRQGSRPSTGATGKAGSSLTAYVRGVTGNGERPWVSLSPCCRISWSFPIVGGAVNLEINGPSSATVSRCAWTGVEISSPRCSAPMRCSKDPSRRGRSGGGELVAATGGAVHPAAQPQRPIRSTSEGIAQPHRRRHGDRRPAPRLVPDAVAATYVDAMRSAIDAEQRLAVAARAVHRPLLARNVVER